jgi:hypothetical protein
VDDDAATGSRFGQPTMNTASVIPPTSRSTRRA